MNSIDQVWHRAALAEERALGSGGGTQARIERQMVGYKEPVWKKKYLSPEEKQRRDWLRAQGMRDTSNDQKYMPDALRKQKTQELEAACTGKPWLRRNWPMVMDTRPGGDYLNFTGVISGGYDGSPVIVATEEAFLTYSTEWLKQGNLDPVEVAEMNSFIATAQAIVDARTQKQEAREISNQNLELSNFKDIDSPVQVAAQAMQAVKTKNWGKGLATKMANWRNADTKPMFKLGDMPLSKSQSERVETMTMKLGYEVLQHRLPDIGDESDRYATLNCFIGNSLRWYAFQAMLESQSAPRSYTDEDGKVRNVAFNRIIDPDFDASQFDKD